MKPRAILRTIKQRKRLVLRTPSNPAEGEGAPGWAARVRLGEGAVYMNLYTVGGVSSLTFGMEPTTRWPTKEQLQNLIDGYGLLLPYYDRLELVKVGHE